LFRLAVVKSFLDIVIGDEQFGELAAALVPLFDIVQPRYRHHVYAGNIVQLPYLRLVAIAEKPLALDSHEAVEQALVALPAEVRVAVVLFRSEVRRVEVEEALGPVVVADEFGEVFVLNDDAAQPVMRSVDGGKIRPQVMGPAMVAVASRGITKAYELIEFRGFVNVAHRGILLEQVKDDFEILAGIKDIPQGFFQLIRVIPHASEKVRQQGVEVVIYFEWAGALVE